jgi:serine/threonine protein phosphatase PrpC
MTTYRTRSAAVTDKGVVRQNNEDSIVVSDDTRLWAVADGMGGHERGEWASGQVAARLRDFAPADFNDNLDQIGALVQRANRDIVDAAQRSGSQMGTTVAILHVYGENFATFWAGDSRVYLLREQQLFRLTKDHSQVQELVDAGVLDSAGADRHPARNVLTRAVGTTPDLSLDAVVDKIEADDLFLLCSDGLTTVVNDHEIAAALSLPRLESAIQKLATMTMQRGAPDNFSIICVACEEATSVPAGG